PACRDRAAARRQGAGARRRPRVRLARRREGDRRAGARAPADRGARGACGRAVRWRPRARDARAHPGPGMTHRGRVALALGGATYRAAWAFGSKVLSPVALGLIAAVVLAWAWTRLANRPLELRRYLPSGERLEGDDVKVRLELRGERRLVPAKWIVHERV